MSDASKGRNRRGGGRKKESKGADNLKSQERNSVSRDKQPAAMEATSAEEESAPPPSLPATPHRAFCAFNDSVDNINLEDIRDLLPDEHHWRSDARASALSAGIVRIEEEREDGAPERVAAAAAAEGNGKSHRKADQSPACTPDRVEAAVAALVGEEPAGSNDELPDFCSALDPTDAELEAAARVAAQMDDRNYIFGPTHFPPRRSGLLWSLDHLSRPSAARSEDRSVVEAAEMLLLTLATACGLGCGRAAAPSRDDILKFRGEGAASTGSAEREEAACGGGGASWGARVRGALGYVLHTLLSIYYQIFVHVPLLVLRAAAALVWSLTTTAFALAYVCVSLAAGCAMWLALLPLRTAERIVVRLWQRALSLAVAFLNQPPSDGQHFGAAHSFPPHKHAIPTALNGHVHKH